ncbi:MAG: septum formation initiator family protein [Candidatus Ventricola sp.]|nr:septum formation initiator family protein [Candidatus Ventricola sp.]
MKKNRVRIRPFRILSVVLGVIALVILSRFPAKAVSLERQQQQLEAAAQAYYDAQSRNNQLTTELSEINTADFVERTARRDYGYCWYGETIYEVGNLHEIAQEPEFDVYGED